MTKQVSNNENDRGKVSHQLVNSTWFYIVFVKTNLK